MAIGDFIEACKGIFWFFTAPLVVSAALLVLTNIKDDFAGYFGMGIYYGTAILYGIPEELGWENRICCKWLRRLFSLPGM